MYELMKKLIKAPSASGRERLVGNVIAEIIKPYCDNVKFDAMGNLIAFKKGESENAKKLMFAAHMDEIGFIVTHIEDNGYIRISPIGGINFGACAYTNVIFQNGIRGIIVPEANTSSSDWNASKMVIDIGASKRKEAEHKIKIGDTAIYEPRIEKLLNRRIAGHPLDDKLGCAVMIKALKEAKKFANDTYFVFTVQEEVGCRGSKTAAYAIMPDWAVAFDVTGTGDSQGSKPMAVKLGGGAAVKLKDSSVICDGMVVDLLKTLAEQNKIKYQLEILEYGGTDTSSMQAAGEGALSGCISIPSRYIHSGVETADLRDCEACISLACALIEYKLQ